MAYARVRLALDTSQSSGFAPLSTTVSDEAVLLVSATPILRLEVAASPSTTPIDLTGSGAPYFGSTPVGITAIVENLNTTAATRVKFTATSFVDGAAILGYIPIAAEGANFAVFSNVSTGAALVLQNNTGTANCRVTLLG